MPRRPDIKSTETLSIKARGESEKNMIRDFKKLSNQDDVDMTDLFFEAMDLLFKVHHWPPGNPQRTLDMTQKPLVYSKCKCGRTAVKHGVHLASGVKRDFCVLCFSEVPGRHDPKIWRFT